jgi:DUF971 family protein
MLIHRRKPDWSQQMIDALTATEGSDALRIDWSAGGCSVLSAATLRREAKDAQSIRQRIDFGEIRITPGLRIEGLEQVGAAGVNIRFSDGHSSAIYPFAYLRALCDAHDNLLTEAPLHRSAGLGSVTNSGANDG